MCVGPVHQGDAPGKAQGLVAVVLAGDELREGRKSLFLVGLQDAVLLLHHAAKVGGPDFLQDLVGLGDLLGNGEVLAADDTAGPGHGHHGPDDPLGQTALFGGIEPLLLEPLLVVLPGNLQVLFFGQGLEGACGDRGVMQGLMAVNRAEEPLLPAVPAVAVEVEPLFDKGR